MTRGHRYLRDVECFSFILAPYCLYIHIFIKLKTEKHCYVTSPKNHFSKCYRLVNKDVSLAAL